MYLKNKHRALREHNNDVEAALASLTSISTGNHGDNDRNEALAVLQSLGVPPEAASEVLERTGTLSEALREMGISPPEGLSGGSTGGQDCGGHGGTGEDSGRSGRRGTGVDDEDDNSKSEAGEGNEEGEEGGEESGKGPTEEERNLFDELVRDRDNDDEESYLDVSLEDEADAADM